VYLAAWLALPVMVVIAIVQNVKTKFEQVDWSRTLIYFTLLTCLGVAFTPTFDLQARSMAEFLIPAGFFFLILDRKPR
jgi:hypothetical protein